MIGDSSPYVVGGSHAVNTVLATLGWVLAPSVIGGVVALLIDRQLANQRPSKHELEQRLADIEADLEQIHHQRSENDS